MEAKPEEPKATKPQPKSKEEKLKDLEWNKRNFEKQIEALNNLSKDALGYSEKESAIKALKQKIAEIDKDIAELKGQK